MSGPNGPKKTGFSECVKMGVEMVGHQLYECEVSPTTVEGEDAPVQMLVDESSGDVKAWFDPSGHMHCLFRPKELYYTGLAEECRNPEIYPLEPSVQMSPEEMEEAAKRQKGGEERTLAALDEILVDTEHFERVDEGEYVVWYDNRQAANEGPVEFVRTRYFRSDLVEGSPGVKMLVTFPDGSRYYPSHEGIVQIQKKQMEITMKRLQDVLYNEPKELKNDTTGY